MDRSFEQWAAQTGGSSLAKGIRPSATRRRKVTLVRLAGQRPGVYLSHPVRRLREGPIEDESVTLLVRAADEEEVDALADRLAAHGTVEDRLRFGTVKVTVPQTAVAAVCELDGVESIETTNTLKLDPDGAGEDVELDGS